MSRQNQILGIVAIVVVIVVGALIFWPEAVEEPAQPVATTEGGGTASTDATAPTADATVGTEGGSQESAQEGSQTTEGGTSN